MSTKITQANKEIEMAVIWGEKIGGKHGSMTAEDIAAFITSKVGGGSPAWKASLLTAAGNVLGHDGRGNGSVVRHNGKSIRHITTGKGAGHVTLFFTLEPGEVGSVIGVGSHHDEKGASYDIDWHTPGWVVGKRVNL
ncbi:hypothetical protein ASD82_12580 [Rhodanobacter sp. Root179]|uniref:hypothetical protein n=2 Tax=unclassified Rhodanobacter TaxID=2621553 RepID=UPI000700DB3D|nr:hypothetical protein [Rhodanobacter sp. Root179]KRB37471.1 hypothetical protein ASD82_12580 [Rhodanobacter sp. Root179]